MKKSLKPNESNVLLIGFPSNGLVGTFTISYIIYYMKMELVGEIEHEDIPPTLFVEDGEIMTPIRIYKKNNIHVIISDIPFEPVLAYHFADSILEYCQKNNIQQIIIVSGMETINNEPKSLKIYGLVTHQVSEKILYDNRIPKFLSGSIFGTDAAMLTVFRKSKIPTLILYAECHPFFPDPEASINAISTIGQILKIKIDTKDIEQRVERLRIQHRNLMEETIKALQQQERPQNRAPPIYR